MSTRSQRRNRKHLRTEAFAAGRVAAQERNAGDYHREAPAEPQTIATAPNGQTVSVPIRMVYDAMTLTALRHLAVQRGLRPNGLRPSKAVKADVIDALVSA